METTRRKLMSTAAIAPVMFVSGGMAGGAVVSCGPNGIVIDPAVLNAIQQAVATTCSFIPSVISIAALIAASFPVLAGVVTVPTAVLQEISHMLCAAAPNPATLKAGIIPSTSVELHGWVIQNGKLVYV